MLTLLVACTGPGSAPADLAAAVALDGMNYQIEQLTASTWSATPRYGHPLAAAPHLALRNAIEKASACQVTDSTAGLQGRVLYAQVDCASRLEN